MLHFFGKISVTEVDVFESECRRDNEKEDIGFYEKPVINQQYTGKL